MQFDSPSACADSGSTFFTINDLCIRWKCHFQTVRGFIRQGKLKPTRFGRCIRFSRREVERFETASTAA